MSQVTQTSSAPPDVHYPSSDGRPLGETGWHITATATLLMMLKEHLAPRGAYVAGNMFLYYEEGNPKANRSPDCMVILGVGTHERRSFKTWVEGTIPSVIFEFSSDETYREDLGAKKDLYARLGVAEYFLFDPLGDCLDPRLQGFRLENGVYVPIEREANGGLTSRVLNLRFYEEGVLLQPVDLATGERLLTMEEQAAEMRRLAEQREQDRRRAEALAEEVLRLKALLEKQNPIGGTPPTEG